MIPLLGIATRELETIGPDEPLDRAIMAMTDAGIRHLPVVRSGELVGILSDRDLFIAVGGLLAAQRGGSLDESDSRAGLRHGSRNRLATGPCPLKWLRSNVHRHVHRPGPGASLRQTRYESRRSEVDPR